MDGHWVACLLDRVVDHNRIWRHAVQVQLAGNLREAHALALEYLTQVLVQVDELLVLVVLQLVLFDVLPESLNDDGPSGRVNAQQLGQSHLQLELWRLEWPEHSARRFNRPSIQPESPTHLVVKEHQDHAFEALVTVTLDLETVRLRRLWGSMPLELENEALNPRLSPAMKKEKRVLPQLDSYRVRRDCGQAQ